MAEVRLKEQELKLLLGSGSGDACLLYLHIKSTGALTLSEAAETLHMDARRIDSAIALLGQLGLIAAPAGSLAPQPEVRRYSEQDVVSAQRSDPKFKLLVGEAQRRLGRTLSGEELKTLLGLRDYLRLPTEVIGLLIHYCIQRSRSRGRTRMPSMRAIEQEGYTWADQGIDSVEAAAAYMNRNLQQYAAAARYQSLLGIEGRRLTSGEERYLLQWAQLHMPDEVSALAYVRTCLSVGGLKWPYMDAILRRWDEMGLRSVEAIEQGDVKPERSRYVNQNRQPAYTRGKGAQPAPGDFRQPVAEHPGDFERRAIARLQRRKEE